jgi:xanthosine utilization system XapX-like protein
MDLLHRLVILLCGEACTVYGIHYQVYGYTAQFSDKLLLVGERCLSREDGDNLDDTGGVMAWTAAVAILLVGLLFIFNRRFAYPALALVAIVGIVVAVATLLQPSARQNSKEAVTAKTSVDQRACPDVSKPIAIEFVNGNNTAVQRVSFSLIGRVKEHSSIAYRGFLRDDKIIAPGEASVTCQGLLPLGFAPPRPSTIKPEDYDWSVDISLVDFATR